MTKIAIIYFSKSGITGQLVDALRQGALAENADVFVHKIIGPEIIEGRFINQTLFENLKEVDAIVFASPTYMGGPAAQFKAFADASSDCWAEQHWRRKIAAGITCGSAPNGDQSATLQYFSTLASQHGMIWLGIDVAHGTDGQQVNRLGCQLGVVSYNDAGIANEMDLNTARYLGERIVEVARKLA